MNVFQSLAIFAAGIAAGTVNTIVGSGTLLTFPVLLAFGYPPVVANVSNTVGLAPGSLSGAHGYRSELIGQRARIIRLGFASLLGGITGAILLLVLPASAFKAIVPVFIALALVLVVLQPRLARRLEARRRRTGTEDSPALLGALYGIGVYGGYFGAAQGILLLAVLGLALPESLQRANGLKNVLAMLTNLVAGAIFVVVAHVDWPAALLLAGGSVIGGQAGARVGRRLPPVALRIAIVVVGASAIAKLLLR